jgi:DNA-binding SARP family transcriptional activator
MAVTMGVGAPPRNAAATVPPEAPAVALRMIDGFSLERDGTPLSLSIGTQRLLCFLALHDRPLQRQFVAGVLWPEATEKQAAANLRSALWRLNQPGKAPPSVVATTQHLVVAPSLDVDLRDAVNAANRLLDPSPSVPPPVGTFTGDLLPDWYDDWVVLERERFRQVRLHALEAICRAQTAAGHFPEAIEAGLAAVEGEPFRESAHRLLIEVHLAEGNRFEAIRAYERFRSMLRAEIGVDPSPLMDALLDRARGS